MPLHALTSAFSGVDLLGTRSDPRSGAAALVLLAFVTSFLAVRTSARLARNVPWWPGSVRSGDVHIHHLVWGICLMMLSGFLAFAAPSTTSWWHVIAILFGVGAGFTMDEFALWVRLEDVYWAEEGRWSPAAAIAAACFAALIAGGSSPFGLGRAVSDGVTAAVIAAVLTLSAMCFMKGRLVLGVLGLFVPVVALVGAVRLAQPTSPWARRRYSPQRERQARARFAPGRRGARWRGRAIDLVFGAPSVHGNGS